MDEVSESGNLIESEIIKPNKFIWFFARDDEEGLNKLYLKGIIKDHK